MKLFRFLIAGIVFGIIMVQSEAASWYRIHEMFLFESIHMYGLMGSAVAIGLVGVWAIRRHKLRDIDGNPITIEAKDPSWRRNIFGGLAFGLGWGLIGACPGPLFVLSGMGYVSVLVMLAAALGGAFVYGVVYKKLPH
jgi:uncharacterized membrane protein YedE/YeeE